jgi:hypothetical protein
LSIEEHRISLEAWRDAWFWYRNAPHQQDAITKLYVAIWEADPCLLSEHSEWFQRYRERDKLVKSALHSEGE